MFFKLMNGLNYLLSSNPDWIKDTETTVGSIVDAILWPIFGIVATLGIIYAIVLGVNYAKAESTDKKEEAKKRIINAVVGVVITLALIILLKVFISNMESIKTWVGDFIK